MVTVAADLLEVMTLLTLSGILLRVELLKAVRVRHRHTMAVLAELSVHAASTVADLALFRRLLSLKRMLCGHLSIGLTINSHAWFSCISKVCNLMRCWWILHLAVAVATELSCMTLLGARLDT